MASAQAGSASAGYLLASARPNRPPATSADRHVGVSHHTTKASSAPQKTGGELDVRGGEARHGASTAGSSAKMPTAISATRGPAARRAHSHTTAAASANIGSAPARASDSGPGSSESSSSTERPEGGATFGGENR